MRIPRWLLVRLDSFIDPDDVLIASFLSDGENTLKLFLVASFAIKVF